MFDCNFAVVGDCGPDADGLAGDVPAPVQPDPTRDRPGRHAGQPDLVLDLAVEGLLETKEKQIRKTVSIIIRTIQKEVININI